MNLSDVHKLTQELRRAQEVINVLGLDRPKSALHFDRQAWGFDEIRQQQKAVEATKRFVQHQCRT